MSKALDLELSNVCCWHGASLIVREVSLHLAPGEHVAIVGGNGSGKTTLLRAVMGLHLQVRGHIAVELQVAKTEKDWRTRRRQVAYMPQRHSTGQFPLLLRELLASSLNEPAARQAALDMGLAAHLDQPLYSLSGGQLQRAYLARALGMVAGSAGLLIADEPTASLDFAGQAAIAELLSKLRATVLVVTHDRAVSALCDRVLEMADGQLRAVIA